MLYQWEVGKSSMLDVMRTYWTQNRETETSDPEVQDSADTAGELPDELRQFATTLANGVVAAVEQLDPRIAEAAENWRLERMAVMDRLILRLAVYEFLHQPETPAAVIINEALELARTFSTDDAVRFINGILDNIRRTLERE
jgi:transcription antitermination protein NusB